MSLGDHSDLCFYYSSVEIACVEIGLHDGGPYATKEMIELGIKVPIIMKNFSLQIASTYGLDMEEIKVVAFIISGKNRQLSQINQ